MKCGKKREQRRNAYRESTRTNPQIVGPRQETPRNVPRGEISRRMAPVENVNIQPGNTEAGMAVTETVTDDQIVEDQAENTNTELGGRATEAEHNTEERGGEGENESRSIEANMSGNGNRVVELEVG